MRNGYKIRQCNNDKYWNIEALKYIIEELFPNLESFADYLKDPKDFKKDLFTEEFFEFFNRRGLESCIVTSSMRFNIDRFVKKFKEKRKGLEKE